MATDRFKTYDNESAPSRSPYSVTPSDSVELPSIPKSLYIGTGGTVVLRGIDGAADVIFKNVANGQTIDVCAQYVRATGTTATDIVALA